MVDEKKTSLAEVLRRARDESGMTQEQWAAHLGVAVRTVSRWEQGESIPRGAAKQAILSASSGETLRQLAGHLAPSVAAGLGAAAVGVVVGGPLGAALGYLGGAVGASLLARRGKSLEVEAAFRDAADNLGLTWSRFRNEVGPALLTAKESGATLHDLVTLFESDGPKPGGAS